MVPTTIIKAAHVWTEAKWPVYAFCAWKKPEPPLMTTGVLCPVTDTLNDIELCLAHTSHVAANNIPLHSGRAREIIDEVIGDDRGQIDEALITPSAESLFDRWEHDRFRKVGWWHPRGSSVVP
jgi:hypothetical protein